MPLNERVLDRMADILFASDEILDMITTDEHLPDETTQAIEKSVRHIFHQINELMKKIAD